MNSTLVTHLFNFRSKENGNGIHKTLMKLTITWRKTSEPQGSQQVLQNPDLSFAKNAEMNIQ